jgi:predicted transcriptional regulator of viral defense system
METIAQKIIKTAKNHAVFRASDIEGVPDPRTSLRRMVAKGQLIRVGRGLYTLPDAEVSVHHSMVEAVKRYPGGVICLISALIFHGIGTQMPYATWMMRRDRKPVPVQGPPMRFVYCTGSVFSHGVETHIIKGVEVHVYTPAKTIADCFKYRNKIGLEVALEALQEGWRTKRFTMDELWKSACACRVQSIMQPYLEMLVK